MRDRRPVVSARLQVDGFMWVSRRAERDDFAREKIPDSGSTSLASQSCSSSSRRPNSNAFKQKIHCPGPHRGVTVMK